MRATVLVRPKHGILDPQGEAVGSSLRRLEVEIDGEDPAAAREQLERMCEQLLANPLIESYEIELPAG
jgi:phosphoribosylformylglycinamidine synthase PurS subunit